MSFIARPKVMQLALPSNKFLPGCPVTESLKLPRSFVFAQLHSLSLFMPSHLPSSLSS